MGCLLDDLRAFDIKTDQWTIAAQDEGGWLRTAKQGAERFMAKWIAAERARAALRHAKTCPNVTGRTKERVAQSKRARTGLLATIDSHSGTTSYLLGGGVSATFQHISDVACTCFFCECVFFCLVFCLSLVV